MFLGTDERKVAVMYIISAYTIWGLLPIYWKWLDAVPSSEVLAHRMIWAFVFMVAFVFLRGKWKPFLLTCKSVWDDKKKFLGLLLASVLISVNWFIFIWAVNNDFVVEASLGYYINPLISILLGIIVLKETFTRTQAFSFILAAVGVIFLRLVVK